MTKSVENTNSTETTESTNTEARTDDFGYDIPEGEKAPEEEKPSEETVEKKSTGYGDEDPAEEEKKATGYGDDETEEKPAEEEKAPEDLKEVIKKLPEGIDQEKVLKFATDQKLTKEQVEAYAEMVAKDKINLEENQKAQVQAIRKQWKTELKDDAEFGGENFDKNVFEVEKVLEKHMPNVKKRLTETGNMLPPYIMRDLLGISKLLNPKTTLVNGDPAEVKEEKNFLDEMYQ